MAPREHCAGSPPKVPGAFPAFDHAGPASSNMQVLNGAGPPSIRASMQYTAPIFVAHPDAQ